jgi:ABC-type uncharacterized transport system permease subunit
MSASGRQVAGFLVLLILALPSGLCSGLFTVGGVISLFGGDPVAQGIAGLFLVGSAVGWVFCILMILLGRRLRRRAADGEPPGASP